MASDVKNKNQCNDAIEYEPKLDNKFSLSSGPNKDTLPVVTVRIRAGKKNRENIIAVLTCLWDSGATNIIIKNI